MYLILYNRHEKKKKRYNTWLKALKEKVPYNEKEKKPEPNITPW